MALVCNGAGAPPEEAYQSPEAPVATPVEAASAHPDANDPELSPAEETWLARLQSVFDATGWPDA
ncbi:MAG: hypothetical protein P4M09_28590 [Devosia sp.]|nr:hypothetical protein [Devosia sp.]